MAQLKDLIVNGPSRFIGSVQASADPVQNMELATKQYVDNNETSYTFASGTTGNFTVTPDGGSAQTVSIGKPSTAGTADKAIAANITTTTNAIARYSNTTGSFANSGVTIDGSSNISTSGNLTAKELKGYVTIGQATGTTRGTQATIEGSSNTGSGSSSHAEGYCVTAGGQNSHAEGTYTKTLGGAAHAEGAYTMAKGYSAHAEGKMTIAISSGSHSEGYGSFDSNITINLTGDANSLTYTVENGIPDNLHIGTAICATSTGNGLIEMVMAMDTSENTITLSNTLSSSAISNKTYYYSLSNYAGGYGAHAEGGGTTASGVNSHAEGYCTSATGLQSHAEGYCTSANGLYSHVEGYYTTANRRSQHVFGEFNKEEYVAPSSRGTYVEIVGNGTADNARSNARTLDWNGNQKLAGTNTTSATWNDYAEGRKVLGDFKPGQVVKENGDGTLSLSSSRLARGCEIISDTYGMLISDNEDYPVPIAVAGRVLAYPDKDISTFEIGAPVCSGENGTISQMTEEEERLYPSRILGTVSEIPSYEEWGPKDKKVQVDGRIWIRIR